MFLTLPPEPMATPENINFPAALNEAAEKLPGLTDVLEPDHPGMHTTGLVQAVIYGRPWSSDPR